jgi:hypothetical protein
MELVPRCSIFYGLKSVFGRLASENKTVIINGAVNARTGVRYCTPNTWYRQLMHPQHANHWSKRCQNTHYLFIYVLVPRTVLMFLWQSPE